MKGRTTSDIDRVLWEPDPNGVSLSKKLNMSPLPFSSSDGYDGFLVRARASADILHAKSAHLFSLVAGAGNGCIQSRLMEWCGVSRIWNSGHCVKMFGAALSDAASCCKSDGRTAEPTSRHTTGHDLPIILYCVYVSSSCVAFPRCDNQQLQPFVVLLILI